MVSCHYLCSSYKIESAWLTCKTASDGRVQRTVICPPDRLFDQYQTDSYIIQIKKYLYHSPKLWFLYRNLWDCGSPLIFVVRCSLWITDIVIAYRKHFRFNNIGILLTSKFGRFSNRKISESYLQLRHSWSLRWSSCEQGILQINLSIKVLEKLHLFTSTFRLSSSDLCIKIYLSSKWRVEYWP